jgi:hypothetical protein
MKLFQKRFRRIYDEPVVNPKCNNQASPPNPQPVHVGD